MAVIVVPAGMFAVAAKVWPTARPVAEATVAVALPAVVVTLVVAAGPLTAGRSVIASTPWATVVTPV